MNSNVTAAASGGVSGALTILAIFALKHFGIEVPPEVSTAAMVVMHAALVHPIFNKGVANMVAKSASADVQKLVQDNLRAKIIDSIKAA